MGHCLSIASKINVCRIWSFKCLNLKIILFRKSGSRLVLQSFSLRMVLWKGWNPKFRPSRKTNSSLKKPNPQVWKNLVDLSQFYVRVSWRFKPCSRIFCLGSDTVTVTKPDYHYLLLLSFWQCYIFTYLVDLNHAHLYLFDSVMFISPVDSSHIYILIVSHSILVAPVLKPAVTEPVKPKLETDDHKAKTQGISRVGERAMIFFRTTHLNKNNYYCN